MSFPRFDVIVVGGGHAGLEAALAAARMRVQTLLITLKKDDLGALSCNPSVGGIGKSHLVKEVDALGGAMAASSDEAGIQFRILNRSKGPAVQATRAQTDRVLYKKAIQKYIFSLPCLHFLEASVEQLIVRSSSCLGVVVCGGDQIFADAVVLTSGTFLNGLLYTGLTHQKGGRFGDPAVHGLSDQLRSLGLPVGRLKTGTPPRLDGKTIDFRAFSEQWGDQPTPFFSDQGKTYAHPEQRCCWIAETNERTHDVVRASLDQSPLFSGLIEGAGPRYCPSLEDKVFRFSDKKSHLVFLEPEGLTTDWIYPNGISTSLPAPVQERFVRSIEGLSEAKIVRYGYAIEYDYLDPRFLFPSLESQCVHALFLAGQINGTTGYEEAAAQGILAGINAARKSQDKEPWVPLRSESYIGVLVDDLVFRGVTEPYRMFTSRAEYRLLLREDNADQRLTEKGRSLGTVGDEQWAYFCRKQEALAREEKWLQSTSVRSSVRPDVQDCSLFQLLKRPTLSYSDVLEFSPDQTHEPLNCSWAHALEARVKYSGYIDRQKKEIEKMQFFESLTIPPELDLSRIQGLSHEVRHIIDAKRPLTLGQASRLSGVTPASIQLLRIYLRRCCGI